MAASTGKTRADRGVKFTTHNMDVVGSAACHVFLAAQRRLSVPRGASLFHEAVLAANGLITSRNLQEASVRLQQIERSFLAMATAKTKLTEGEVSSSTRRTVILRADEARRDVIIDETSGSTPPRRVNVLQIRSMPNTTDVTGTT